MRSRYRPGLHDEVQHLLPLTWLLPSNHCAVLVVDATTPVTSALLHPGALLQQGSFAAGSTPDGLLAPLVVLAAAFALAGATWLLGRRYRTPQLRELTRHVEGFAVDQVPGDSATTESAADELDRLRAAFEEMRIRVEEQQEQLYARKAQLQDTLQKLRAADQVKDEFLSFLSHEMKTPLTAIRSFAELLRTTENVEEEEQQEFLLIIEAESQRLELLSSDLLDLARIQMGEMPWRDRLVDPAELVDSANRTLRVLAAHGGCHLLAQHGPNLPAILIDPDRITQVLTNLVSNALKFTPRGGQVTVRVYSVDGESGPALRIEVLDTGPGIPEEQLDQVFAPFVQAHASDATAPRGSGLGLAICRRIVEHYGGSIDARNGERGGAILRVNLPVPTSQAAVESSQQPA